MMNTEITADPSGTFENYSAGALSGNTRPAAWFFDWATDENNSDAGVSVNAWSMLQLAAIWQGINLIAGDVGQIPVRLVKDKFEDQKSHPTWSLLRVRPNDYQTPAVWKETTVQWLILYGNALSHIQRDGAGRPQELIPLHPDWVWPIVVDNGTIQGDVHYHYTSPYSGQSFIFSRDEVLHFKGIGDGWWGYALFDVGKPTAGHGLALQKFGNASFKNGARPSAILKLAGRADPEARKLVRDDFERMHSGSDNSGKVAILPEGMDYVAISQNHQDAQWIEAKRLARQEAASLLNLPLAMLNSYEDSPARATLEENRTQYLQQTLSRIFNLMSQEFARKLLPFRQQRSGEYCYVWDTSDFLKGDIETMAAVAETLVSAAVYNPNEARNMFGMPPYTGGDEYGSPHINPRAAEPTPPTEEEPDEEPPVEETPPAAKAHRRLLTDRVTHIVRREYSAIRESARSATNFLAWLDGYYLGEGSKLMHLAQSAAGCAVDASESVGVPASRIYTTLASYAASRHKTLLGVAELATKDQFAATVELAMVTEPEVVAQGLVTSALGV